MHGWVVAVGDTPDLSCIFHVLLPQSDCGDRLGPPRRYVARATPIAPAQTLRVATTGGTAAARSAGASTAAWPRPHSTSAPIGR